MKSVVNLYKIAKWEAEHEAALKEDAMREKGEQIEGGLADNMTLEDIANRHGVNMGKIVSQINKGIRVEYEHTNDAKQAMEIAKDHLVEDSEYYTKLEMIENH